MVGSPCRGGKKVAKRPKGDPMHEWGPIQMTAAPAGWLAREGEELHEVVGFAVLRCFKHKDCPNVYAPVIVLDGELVEASVDAKLERPRLIVDAMATSLSDAQALANAGRHATLNPPLGA